MSEKWDTARAWYSAIPRFGSPVGPWHHWFAWYPVKSYDQRRIWFRSCWRRCIQKHDYLNGGADFWFQYAADGVPPQGPGLSSMQKQEAA